MAFHATARFEQVLAAFELACGWRECRLQWRQLHDAVELALGERADDASGRSDYDDESRETRDHDLDWFLHCNPGLER
jgi:hypothetical protein